MDNLVTPGAPEGEAVAPGQWFHNWLTGCPEVWAELDDESRADWAEQECELREHFVSALRDDRDRLALALDALTAHPPEYRDFMGSDYLTCGYCHQPIENTSRAHNHAPDCPWLEACRALAPERATPQEGAPP